MEGNVVSASWKRKTMDAFHLHCKSTIQGCCKDDIVVGFCMCMNAKVFYYA